MGSVLVLVSVSVHPLPPTDLFCQCVHEHYTILLLLLLLPFHLLVHVSPPVLHSCSSYFSLLPGAHKSVPDGNLLRLQEPPWRPHGGGTRGKQSSSVLLFYHEPPCHAPSHSFFFIFLPYTCSLLSSSVSSVSSLPGYTGPQGDLILAQVPNPPIYTHTLTHTHASLSTCPAAALPPLSVSFSLPGGKTVRPSSPKLSISDGVYLQRDRPTHLECIFTSVHTPSPSHSFNIAHVCHKTNPCSSLRGSGSLSG